MHRRHPGPGGPRRGLHLSARQRGLALLDGAAVAVFGVLLALLMARLGRQPGRPIVAAAAVVLGYLAADLTSGVVHWLCDRFFEEDSPLIGRVLIQPFREHHRDPLAMTRHGFLELTGNSSLGIAPVLGVALWSDGGPFADAVIATFALVSFGTNLFHRWAHAVAVPPPIRWLQRARLILSPDVHAAHHRPGHGGGYCVTTGWMNPVADGGWAHLERALRAAGVPETTTRD